MIVFALVGMCLITGGVLMGGVIVVSEQDRRNGKREYAHRAIEPAPQSVQLYRLPQPAPDLQQVALGADWTQPRLVAREIVTRELFQ